MAGFDLYIGTTVTNNTTHIFFTIERADFISVFCERACREMDACFYSQLEKAYGIQYSEE